MKVKREDLLSLKALRGRR